jgi:peroxiredoxin
MDPVSLVDQPAPPFTLPDRQGRLRRADEWRGRLTLFVFWSYECSHATRLDARLHHLRQHGWSDVAVVRIACSPESPGNGARGPGLEVSDPILIDEAQQVADLYAARVTPHVVVVDAEGIVRYIGAPDDVSLRQRTPTRSYLEDAVEALRAGRCPEPQAVPAFGCAIARRRVG